jgi:molybdopterin molybdotransferase
MISEKKARERILETVRPLPARRVPVADALDCFAAEDYFARLALPAFDNSQMDGYAVIASDCRKGKPLRVTGEQPAGVHRHLRVWPGEAVRIFTGAPIPAGADAVVMQEEVRRTTDEIVINTEVSPGEFVRRRGCDLSEGQKILAAGERIRETTLALLAAQGIRDVPVGGQARVAIVSTGDELAMPGEELHAGKIYESNSVLLQSLVRRAGAGVASIQHCGDNADSLRQAFEAATKNEVLIVTGGVSVGEHDLVQSVLRTLGARIDIWRVAIKPGKPFLFGRMISGATDCLVFGLPGNPVSAFVTFLQFMRPALLKMMGATNLDLPTMRATLGSDLANDGDRVHYFRGKMESGTFAPIGRQESHALFGLSQSNALLRLGAGETRRRGDAVEIITWS